MTQPLRQAWVAGDPEPSGPPERVHLGLERHEGGGNMSIFRVAMTPEQARQIAMRLLRMAESLERPLSVESWYTGIADPE
jgi:hypothetical protein